MLDLRLFGDRMFRQANIAVMALAGSMLGILFLLPLFLQNMRGLDAMHSGLVTFPQAIGVLIALQPARRLYPRIGPRRMMLFSSVANAAITAAFALVGLGTSLWLVRALILLRGLSMAPAMIAMQVASYATISPAKTGRASSLSSADRQIAAALCVAVLATVFSSRTRALAAGASNAAAALDAQVTAFHQSILVGAGITVLAIVASWFVHDEDAAATMGRERAND
jgi:MFS family permease